MLNVSVLFMKSPNVICIYAFTVCNQGLKLYLFGLCINFLLLRFVTYILYTILSVPIQANCDLYCYLKGPVLYFAPRWCQNLSRNILSKSVLAVYCKYLSNT